MTIADVIQIILGVLSLIATVAVSVVIARVETKRAKRQHTEAIQQQVKEFAMDNESEIDYLPLCVFANAVSPYAANKRQIYNRFNRCTEEVQIEILRHQNIPIGLIKDKNVLDECLDSFDEQALATELWERSWLYEGGKYFHRAIDYYREMAVDDDNPHIFEIPRLNESLAKAFPDFKADLTLYMDRYLEFVLRDQDDTKDLPEKLPQIPPFTAIDSFVGVDNCDESTLCFWMMRFITSGCLAFWHHKLVADRDADWRQLSIGDGVIETYEDMYYDTLLLLYTTYANIKEHR